MMTHKFALNIFLFYNTRKNVYIYRRQKIVFCHL